MVAFVRSEYEKNTVRVKELLDRNEEQVKKLTVSIKEGNERDLLEAIQAGERTLEGMGVVSNKVIPLIRAIEKAGGATKILGGGGRKEGVGFLLCYHHDPKKFAGVPIRLGEEGIRLEAHD